MKINEWTVALAAAGVVSLGSSGRADEIVQHEVLTALSSTTISGYVDTSSQWNFGTGNAHVPAYLFGGPAKADGFNLNVIKLVIEKRVQPSDEWGAGYKVDLLFGPDAATYGTQSTGIPGEVAIKQAYVEVKAPVGNGIDFKMGVWDTILGYEVFETTLNPNFTRSYGYTIEPATFTGILAAYNFNEALSVAFGVADAMQSTINGRATPFRAESFKTYMGDISYTSPSSWKWAAGSTFFVGVVNGFDAVAPAAGFRPADQTSYYAGISLPTPVKDFKVGFSYDYAGVSQQLISPSGYANAVAFYANYQVNEKLSLNGRAEYFTQSKSNVSSGLPSQVFDLTATIEYDLWKNVMSRLEFRWDHAADGSLAYGGGTAAGPATRKNAAELIANIIYKF